MKRITRDRRLTSEEASKYKTIREQVAQELPDLIARHHARMATLDQLDDLVKQLKVTREAKGLSLADLTERTGMDRSALSKLENGQRANPTVETLVRYAEAVGKRLVISLADEGSGMLPHSFSSEYNVMSINELWYSTDSQAWDRALERYWRYVRPENLELERELDRLDLAFIRRLDQRGWYDFLHDKYFVWKYTAKNRLATTRASLEKYVQSETLDALYQIRDLLLALDLANIRGDLATAKEIKGLGVAGASGLLAIMYPAAFGTVDQFAVKALRDVEGLPEAETLRRMNPENLTTSDGTLLIQIMRRKAEENNRLLHTTEWTPRKIDKILWTYGR